MSYIVLLTFSKGLTKVSRDHLEYPLAISDRHEAIEKVRADLPRLVQDAKKEFEVDEFDSCFAVLANNPSRTPVWSFELDKDGNITSSVCEYGP